MKLLFLRLLGIGLFLSILIIAGLLFMTSKENAAIRKERKAVNRLIAVGQDLSAAETLLRKHGYELRHPAGISPALNNDYLQQTVVIGDTRPTFLDTVFYTVTGGANPLRKESPYVVIKASNGRIITKID